MGRPRGRVSSIGAGLIQAFTGEPTAASRVLTILGPTVITLWLLIVGDPALPQGASAVKIGYTQVQRTSV
jgi:hypothetical protein